MSIQRSPPASSGSQPDLSKLENNLYSSREFQRYKRTRDNDDSELILEFRKMFASQISTIAKIHDDLSLIRTQITEMKSTNENFLKELSGLKAEIGEVKRNTSEKIQTLENRIDELSNQIKSNDQRSRLNNVEISGVPVSKSENLNTILHNLAVKVGFPIVDSDVDYIYRVRRFPSTTKSDGLPNSVVPNIIVKFTQRKRKSDLIAAVRARRGIATTDLGIDGPSRPIFVNDHLAPHNKLLYKQARLLGKEKAYRFIWLNDCKIFLRKNESSKPIIISNEVDLLKIK